MYKKAHHNGLYTRVYPYIIKYNIGAVYMSTSL